MASPTTPECTLLTRLPLELRELIYHHILSFPRPLKLRQIVAGSKNTSILRTNSQIYHEALSIFYAANTILATRNDFCQDTDPDLQTPLRRDCVRHLLILNFSQSIRCSSYSGGNNLFLSGCCDVCKPNAAGFIAALAGLPRLKSVVIDFHNHHREFEFIRQTTRAIGSTHVEAEHGFQLECTSVARYRLTSPSLPKDLEITFTDLPFHIIWTALITLRVGHKHFFGVPGEEDLLFRLRDEEHRELPDKLNHVICMRHSIIFPPIGDGELWREVEEAEDEGRNAERALGQLTEQIVEYLDGNRLLPFRKLLEVLRESEGSAYRDRGLPLPEGVQERIAQ